MAEAYDALVVGAGLSGLAAGIRLAHFGRRVAVVERHERVGGLNSWYRRAGRELSVGLHAMTNVPFPRPGAAASSSSAAAAAAASGAGGALARLLRQLRIRRDEWRLLPQRRSSIRFPGATLVFDNDPERLAASVADNFPAEADGFARLRQAVFDTDETVTDGHRPQSARERVAGFVRDPLLADMLAAPPMFYGAPTAKDMDWTAFCVLWKGIYETGLAIPENGMRPLLERLVERLREAGGELCLGTGVEELAIERSPARADAPGGRVAEARLSDGRVIRPALVFSSAGWPETRALVQAPRNPGQQADADAADGDKAAAGEISPISIVEAMAAFPGTAADAGLVDATLFYSFEPRLRFGPPAEGLWRTDNGVLAAPGNFVRDDSRPRATKAGSAEATEATEADKATVSVEGQLRLSALAHFGRWRDLLGGVDARRAAPRMRAAYAEAKARAAESLWSSARRLGLRTAKPPEFVDIFTPLTLARYTGHVAGALYGSPQKRRDARTPWDNLFLIGADQGFHGIVGAMLSGVTVANRHGLGEDVIPSPPTGGGG